MYIRARNFLIDQPFRVNRDFEFFNGQLPAVFCFSPPGALHPRLHPVTKFSDRIPYSTEYHGFDNNNDACAVTRA